MSNAMKTATGFFEHEISGDISDSYDLALGDVDGDGDLDFFEANYGPNKIWENAGGWNFYDSGQTLGSSKSYDVALGDVDGDGDLDAFVAELEGPDQVWLNVSTDGATKAMPWIPFLLLDD